MKFGLEMEGFYLVGGNVAVVPHHIPHDDCGWLVEYRGQPFNDPFEAVGSLVANVEAVSCNLPQDSDVVRVNHMPVPRKVKLEARRVYSKGVSKYQNLYGKTPSSLDHAGIHVSFTDPCVINHQINDRTISTTVNRLWDYAQIFRKLDKMYAAEIKEARRVPGFYEIKPDLRIEYRSLPTTVNLWDLARNLKKLFAER